MRTRSAQAAAVLARLQAYPADHASHLAARPARDVVPFDFAGPNILVAEGRITGVVDWGPLPGAPGRSSRWPWRGGPAPCSSAEGRLDDRVLGALRPTRVAVSRRGSAGGPAQQPRRACTGPGMAGAPRRGRIVRR
jgi:hypothetical protein